MQTISSAAPVLPYTGQAFRNNYEDEHIAEFVHRPFVEGMTHLDEARKIVGILNELSARETKSISFNPEMLSSNQLTGGSCSVLALRVAKAALGIIEELNKKAHLSKFDKQLLLFKKIQQEVEKMNDEGKKSPKNQDVKLRTRTLQQAFNTITVDRTVQVPDVSQDKIKALAGFYGLTVSQSTPEVQVKDNPDLRGQLNESLKSLECGVHILRIIDFKNNHKLENCGHSATYIKTPKMVLYFDPALGLYHLFGKEDFIHNALLSANQRFNIDFFRFHKLQKLCTD